MGIFKKTRSLQTLPPLKGQEVDTGRDVPDTHVIVGGLRREDIIQNPHANSQYFMKVFAPNPENLDRPVEGFVRINSDQIKNEPDGTLTVEMDRPSYRIRTLDRNGAFNTIWHSLPGSFVEKCADDRLEAKHGIRNLRLDADTFDLSDQQHIKAKITAKEAFNHEAIIDFGHPAIAIAKDAKQACVQMTANRNYGVSYIDPNSYTQMNIGITGDTLASTIGANKKQPASLLQMMNTDDQKRNLYPRRLPTVDDMQQSQQREAAF